MPRLSDCRRGDRSPGVSCLLSPRTRGEVVLQAVWSTASGGVAHRERITLAAAARSPGLPNVPVDARLYLGGSGWRVKESPPEGRATVEEREGVSTLRPDSRRHLAAHRRRRACAPHSSGALRRDAPRLRPLRLPRRDRARRAIVPHDMGAARRLQERALGRDAAGTARSTDDVVLRGGLPCHRRAGHA